MELIDRYVQAVGARLNPSRRTEIEAELRASILDALDARGATPDSEADVVAVLAELGAPDAVAAEYEPSRRYLIGPELFPDFMLGLRVSLTTLLIGCTVMFGIAVVLGGFTDFRAGELLMDALRLGVWAAIVGVVMMVAVFAWMQRANVRFPKQLTSRPMPWNPHALKGARVERLSRIEAIFGLFVSAVVLMILGVIGESARDALVTAPAQFRPLLADGVVTSVLLLQGGAVLAVIAHAIALGRGGWGVGTRTARFAGDVIALYVFARVALIMAAQRTAMAEAGLTPAQADWAVYTAFAVAAVIATIVGVYWWRAWRRSGGRAPQVTAMAGVIA